MKKRILLGGICALLIITIVLLFNGKKSILKKDGVTYALTVNGVRQNNFPSKGTYRVDANCSNATCKWDYEKWKLYIENITGEVSCNISFTTISKIYLNDYIAGNTSKGITGLVGTTQGTGSVVNEKGYRYEGQDPNNYVWFNNEIWRIIGVFDSTSHGVANVNLVKIIRSEILGGLAWDKSNKNNWSTASLKSLLNTEYINSTDGTNGGNCYGYSTTAKAKCDYRTSGLKEYQDMIKEVTWYLGGYSRGTITVDSMYERERNSSSKYGGNPTSVNAKIGLMYTSDYGYAVPAANCARTTNISSYSSVDCTLNNWLYGNGHEWTIMHRSSNASDVFHVNTGGYVDVDYSLSYAKFSYTVRPTLYLNENVYVIDGDGSITNPYIIGM